MDMTLSGSVVDGMILRSKILQTGDTVDNLYGQPYLDSSLATYQPLSSLVRHWSIFFYWVRNLLNNFLSCGKLVTQHIFSII